jgi:hypothetical protein
VSSQTITFLGTTYNRADLPQNIINYIETYNRNEAIAKQKNPADTDYVFRMNQALQMFGDPTVVAGIQLLIDSAQNQN